VITVNYLVLKAFLKLYRCEFDLLRSDFSALHERVRGCLVRRRTEPKAEDVERICRAVDIACIWYWKKVLCLQRSAATVSLLRDYGVPAEMVIGAQQMPFRAHAWVEVRRRIVNDKPYVSEIYAVLDRC
jgi:hypothetical protein